MKKRHDRYREKSRVRRGLQHERGLLAHADALGIHKDNRQVLGFLGDVGAVRWRDEHKAAWMGRLEGTPNVLKQRDPNYDPPIEHEGVNMYYCDVRNQSGLDLIAQLRYNLFDGDSESGPIVMLRIYESVIRSAINHGHSIVCFNNMIGPARGKTVSKTWWSGSKFNERQEYVRQRRVLLPELARPSDLGLDDHACVNAAAFLLKVRSAAAKQGARISISYQGFYKKEGSPLTMVPSVFSIEV